MGNFDGGFVIHGEMGKTWRGYPKMENYRKLVWQVLREVEGFYLSSLEERGSFREFWERWGHGDMGIFCGDMGI
jgi:hypothetical protein